MRGLYAAKPWFTRQLRRFVVTAVDRRWSPDAFTVAGVLFAVVAALGLLVGLWPLVLIGLIGRLAGANLDGAVARARGVSRPLGFVLNEIGDRVSDLLPFAALTVLAWQTQSPLTLMLTLVAASAASWPTFMSLAVAGAGGPRLNGGPYGKTERTLTVLLAAVALEFWPPEVTLNLTAAVVIVGSAVTAVTRFVAFAKPASSA